MAITASGFYGLTLEKIFRKTQTDDLESETAVWCMMITNGATPNFDTHDFVADVTNEVTAGSGYTAGGKAVTGTELTVGSPAAGQVKYDATDVAWAASTIADAKAAVLYYTTGSTATAPVIYLSAFVTAATCSNGTFTIQWDANGIWYLDYTP